MGFHYSAEDIRIDDDHMLRARLQRADGEWNDAEIDLNNHIGNDNGHFVWDGEGFSGSAENVYFSLESDGQAAVLRATLFDGDGNGEERDLNLGERIGNNDGEFSYSMLPHRNCSQYSLLMILRLGDRMCEVRALKPRTCYTSFSNHSTANMSESAVHRVTLFNWKPSCAKILSICPCFALVVL
ncbi:CVNH domain-containing protein [Ampelomyces quisqualis]|uniref:CVNH domain-containing protein n=1 Tax=Ampelomyces quisqualis TaxID=50730 RepID=A0A6A5QJ68_AMPQU|nr:CVNH domain-containing protein [Ampelomyces quisqualis]